MKVKLSKVEIEYILNVLVSGEPRLSAFFKNARPGSLEIEDDILDDTRELALERLPLVGFDLNYQLNDEGVLLERFIDRFFTG